MSQNHEKILDSTKDQLKEKENLDIILSSNTESYQIMKNQKKKPEKKCVINYEEIKNDDYLPPNPKRRRRSNSIDLYKKNQRNNERKKRLNKECSKNLMQNNLNIASDEKENDIPNNQRKSNKDLNDCKSKKVSFPKNFVTFIDVESYKQFNIENTSKDPFEDMEFLNNIHNKYNININTNDNKNEVDEGKERVTSSCLIF